MGQDVVDCLSCIELQRPVVVFLNIRYWTVANKHI